MSKKKILKTTKTNFFEAEFSGISLDALIKSLETLREELGSDHQVCLHAIDKSAEADTTYIDSIDFDTGTWAVYINYRKK